MYNHKKKNSTKQFAEFRSHTDGLVQDYSNPIANALGLLQSYTKSSIFNQIK